tara:strand:+ start:406 stop:1095 length:690 start_codon:yes stop_codon:yes gene_type:complete
MKEYLLALLIILFLIYIFCDKVEGFTQELYENLMNDFSKIFPSGNRNAGGPQFYHHIVSMNPSREEYIKYNTFYCAVSGSPIDPDRGETYNNIIVDGLDGKKYYGKYYRCCWPCSCDIMRDDLVLVEDFTLSLRDGDYTHKVLTINDPCLHSDRIPDEITCFECENDMTQNGIHTDSGRLIIGILHDVEEYTNQVIDDNLSNMCESRNSTPIDELRGGMGDISLKLYSL